MVGVTTEKAVVELIGLLRDGREEGRSLPDVSEAREERDELILDEGFGSKLVFDDGGEGLVDFFGVEADVEEEKGWVREDGRMWGKRGLWRSSG